MRHTETYADVKIRILKKEGSGYWVELTCNDAQEFPGGKFAPVVLSHTLDPEKIGEALFEQLFADECLKCDWATIRGQYPLRRIRLWIDADAPELHTIPWELLRDATIPDLAPQTLAADTDTPFSRYLAGQWPPGRLVDSRSIKLLIALASPTDLKEYGLSTIDVMTKQQTLQTAFTEAGVTAEQLDITFLPQPVTLTAIEQALKHEYHLLHIIAHGIFLKDDELAVLFLANESNTVQRVTDQEFAAMLQRVGTEYVPQLVFLSSCQTATRSAADAYRGFAPTIVKAGVPTVVAMQANIPISTARQFAASFYRQLLQHGQVDLACNEARSAVLTAKLYGAGIPVLFMRLRDGQLFSCDRQPAEEISDKLHGVPELPPHFLERPETLDSLKATILNTEDRAVAVTSAQKIGVHGMGGIGKTVLAATLARDEEVRQRFSDGVFWIVLGQTPDLVTRQQQVAKTLSGKPEAFVDEQEGKVCLQELLAQRSCLLILDDAWEMPHISVFNVVGERSQLLITTRNANLITGLGGETYDLNLLTSEQSRKLLSTWANQSDLPPQADDLIKECGYLPLAVAMVGAMLRDQASEEDWDDVLTLLREAELEEIEQVFPEYAHPNLFRALHVSVNALAADIRERYFDFAVFPEDTPVPVKVLEIFWSGIGLEKIHVKKTLSTLRDRSLLRWDDTDKLTLHDLQRDYVRNQTGNDQSIIHQRLLDAYARLLQSDHKEEQIQSNLIKKVVQTLLSRLGIFGRREIHQWSNGPNDGYFFENLCYHLYEAGNIEELNDLLLHFPWLQAKLDHCGVNALLSDYDLLPQEGKLKLLRYTLQLSAHILAQDPTQLPSQLHGRLCAQTIPAIKTLLTQTRGKSLWLRPITCSLTPPGGALLRTLTGHTDGVNAVALMPDGRQAVSASSDGTLKVWDLETGMEVYTLSEHTDRDNGESNVVLTPDGSQLISVSSGGTLKLWDLTSRTCVRTVHTDKGFPIAVMPDKRWVVSYSFIDKTCKVWDLTSGMCVHTLGEHTDVVASVAIMPDGRQAVSASYDHTLKVWNLASDLCVRTLEGHTAGVTHVTIMPDGRQAVSGSNDHTLKVWVLETGKCLHTLKGHPGIILAIAVTPDGRQAVSASDCRSLKVWDLETGKCVRTLEEHNELVSNIVMMSDGRRTISVSLKTLKMWDLVSGSCMYTLEGHTSPVNDVKVTSDGKLVITASSDGTLKVWDLTQETSTSIPLLIDCHTNGIRGVVVTPNGRQAISASKDKTLKVWDMTTGAVMGTLGGHKGDVNSIAVTPDGGQVVSASADGTLKLWELATGKEACTLSILNGQNYDERDWINGVTVTPNGSQVISASWDNMLRVWDLKQGRLVKTFEGHTNYVNAVKVTPDGEWVVSASDDGTLKVWNLMQGKCKYTLKGHTEGVRGVAVAPDGRQAISVSFDKTVKVWDLSQGTLIHTFTGHNQGIRGVAIMPNGFWVISASNDRTLKMWDLNSKLIIAGFSAEGALEACAVAPDGKTIVTGGASGRVHFLRVEKGELHYRKGDKQVKN